MGCGAIVCGGCKRASELIMLYIDVTRLYENQRRGKQITGVDRVSLAYIEQFSSIACVVIRLSKQWLFLPKNQSNEIFANLIMKKPIRLPSRFFRFKYCRPADGKNFLLHTAHNGLEKTNFIELMTFYDLRGIYFLHDLIPIEYPEYCRVGSYQQHRQRLLAMSKADMVICNSYDVFNKFIGYCRANGLSLPKTIWAHLGVNNALNTQVITPIIPDVVDNHPFFLMVGTIEGRKNHWLMLNVWRILIDEMGESCPKLVIVGKRGWECEQVLATLDRSINLKNCVVELNQCIDSQLTYLLTKTQALLFPSNAEGFGLPLVEALLLRVPVIASDIPIFQEIGLDVVKLLSPFDTAAWKDVIVEYMLPESEGRNNQIQKIESIQDKLPTWQKHFEVVSKEISKLMKINID